MFVVFKVAFQNALQRLAVKNEHMIQTLATQRADETLGIRVLPWVRYPTEKLQRFAGRPCGGRMRRDVEVNGVSPVMGHHHKYKQKRNGSHYQKICCNYLLNVALEKRAPAQGLITSRCVPDEKWRSP